MKKVLILAWDFPPYQAIGAARPNSWFKNFKKNGLYPIVVTRHWDDELNFKDAYIRSSKIQETIITENEFGTIIKTPYKSNFRDRLIIKYGYRRFVIIRKIYSFITHTFSYRFNFLSNKRRAYHEALNYLRQKDIDLIIATGEPFILHKFAFKLSQKTKTPYILDYRDGWTTRDDNLRLKGPKKWLNDYFFRYFEKKYLKEASCVITSNPFELPKIQNIAPHTKMFNVYNGYVESEVGLGQGIEQLSDCFRIGYAGTIYPYNRVEDFLEGLKLFILKNPKAKFELRLLGIQSQPDQLKRIENYDPILKSFIESTPRLEKKDLIEWFCKCNSLLIFTNPEIHLLPSKVYEYLPLKRKIIVSVNDESDLKDIMEMTNAGFNCNNAEEIANSIESMYKEFIETGKVKSEVKDFEQFSRVNQAKNLTEIIKSEMNYR